MLRPLLLLPALLGACAAFAGEPAPAQLPPVQPGWTVVPDSEPVAGKPDAKIEKLVVEDKNARITELRERGEVKKVSVHPKIIPAPDYEVTVGDAGVEPFLDNFSGNRGAARSVGRTVWSVVDF